MERMIALKLRKKGVKVEEVVRKYALLEQDEERFTHEIYAYRIKGFFIEDKKEFKCTIIKRQYIYRSYKHLDYWSVGNIAWHTLDDTLDQAIKFAKEK